MQSNCGKWDDRTQQSYCFVFCLFYLILEVLRYFHREQPPGNMMCRCIFPLNKTYFTSGANFESNKDEIAKKGGLDPLVQLLDNSDAKVWLFSNTRKHYNKRSR